VIVYLVLLLSYRISKLLPIRFIFNSEFPSEKHQKREFLSGVPYNLLTYLKCGLHAKLRLYCRFHFLLDVLLLIQILLQIGLSLNSLFLRNFDLLAHLFILKVHFTQLVIQVYSSLIEFFNLLFLITAF